MIAYKFVKWDIDPLEKLKETEVYKMREKVLAGKTLTRKEKDSLYEMLKDNSYSRIGVPLQGWMFDFSNILKSYFVEYNGGYICRTCAPDKMSIRNNENGIRLIREVN